MAALSGQRTFAELKGDIAALVGGDFSFSSTSYPTTTQANQIVNRFYKRLFASRNWKWVQKSTTFDTTAGTTDYTLPDDVAEEVTLRIANIAVALVKTSREQFLQEIPGGWTNTGSGTPIMYMHAGEASNNAIKISIWPVPSATWTITMDYRARFTPLSADGDYTIVPPEYEDYIVYASAAEIMLMLGDERAASLKAEAERVRIAAWLEDEQELDSVNTWRTPGLLRQGYPGLIHPYWGY